MSAIDTRGLSRDSLFLLAEISVADAPFESIKVRNLSDTGMMGEGSLALSRGDCVVVALRNVGKVRGRIAWTQGTRFGVSFEKIIDPKLARAPSSGEEAAVPRYARPATDPLGMPPHPSRLRRV